MSRLFTFGLMLGMFSIAPPVRAADDAPAPPAGKLGEKQWQFNDYLKGDDEHIRKVLNSEVERLVGRIKETRGEIARANKDCDNDIKTAQDQLHQSAVYKQTVAEKKQAEIDLAAARAGGSAEDRVAASSRFNKARTAIDKMEKDAIVNCKPLLDDQRHAYEMGHEIKRLQEALDKATKWRENLLEGLRNTFAMPMPVDVGSQGTLPKSIVEEVIDGNHVLVIFEAFEKKGPGKEQEGLTSFSVVTKKLKVLVSGVDTKGMKQGDKRNFDQVFAITSKTADGAGTVFVANPKAADANQLFDTIVPLRDSLPESKAPKGDKAE